MSANANNRKGGNKKGGNKKGKVKTTVSPVEVSPIRKHRNRNKINCGTLEIQHSHLSAPEDLDKERTTGTRTRGTGSVAPGKPKEKCFYVECGMTFTGDGASKKLFNHMVIDHIGGNHAGPYDLSGGSPLDLQCRWRTCPHGYSDDRNKAISHCLVHCPGYHPSTCKTCGQLHQKQEDLDEHKVAFKH